MKLTGFIIPVVLGVTWEVAVQAGWATGRLMPPPSHLLHTAIGLAASGELWTHIAATMTRIGLGFLFGNGGPMSTVGYMGGFLDVVSS